jgi:hypothetical protein
MTALQRLISPNSIASYGNISVGLWEKTSDKCMFILARGMAVIRGAFQKPRHTLFSSYANFWETCGKLLAKKRKTKENGYYVGGLVQTAYNNWSYMEPCTSREGIVIFSHFNFDNFRFIIKLSALLSS